MGKQPDLFMKPSGRTAILTTSGFVLDLNDPDATDRKLAPTGAALARRFSFKPHLGEVKKADLVAMSTELHDLLPNGWLDWGNLPPPASCEIQPVGRNVPSFCSWSDEETKHLAQTVRVPYNPTAGIVMRGHAAASKSR